MVVYASRAYRGWQCTRMVGNSIFGQMYEQILAAKRKACGKQQVFRSSSEFSHFPIWNATIARCFKEFFSYNAIWGVFEQHNADGRRDE